MSNAEFTLEHNEVEAEESQQELYVRGIYPRGLRFKDGEEIVAGVHCDDFDWTIKKFILIHQPMKFDPVSKKFVPWSALTDDYVFEIATDLMRTMYDLKEKYAHAFDEAAREQHYEFLREEMADSNTSDERRASIEEEILMTYGDGSETEDEPEPERYNHIPVSKTYH